MSLRARLLIGAALSAVSIGCGEEPAPVSVPVRLEITSSDSALLVGRSISFSAVAYDSRGGPAPVGPVQWSVSDTALGSIGADGVFVAAMRRGDVWVRAKLGAPPLRDSFSVHVAVPGEEKWRYTPATGRVFDGIGGVALATDGTIYVLEDIDYQSRPTRSALVALNSDGSKRWSVELPGVLYNYPVVTPVGSVMVAGQTIYLVAPTGAIQWQRVTPARVAGSVDRATHD